MDLTQITPLILTFNEKENIGRTVSALSRAREVVILDSGSTDSTLDIARCAHPNVRVVTRAFDDHTRQWNFGLDEVTTPWVLSLDADYLVTPSLIREIEQLTPSNGVCGYSVQFRYCIRGVPLRSSVYPARTVLFRRDCGRYYDDGHTQRLRENGTVLALQTKVDHDDRKPFGRWFQEQRRYTKIEARYLLFRPLRELSPQDQLRRTVIFAPAAIFFYLLFLRGLIFDGWRGWYYVSQRTIAELLLAIRLVVEKLKP